MDVTLLITKEEEFDIDIDRLKQYCPHGVYEYGAVIKVEEFLKKIIFFPKQLVSIPL